MTQTTHSFIIMKTNWSIFIPRFSSIHVQSLRDQTRRDRTSRIHHQIQTFQIQVRHVQNLQNQTCCLRNQILSGHLNRILSGLQIQS